MSNRGGYVLNSTPQVDACHRICKEELGNCGIQFCFACLLFAVVSVQSSLVFGRALVAVTPNRYCCYVGNMRATKLYILSFYKSL